MMHRREFVSWALALLAAPLAAVAQQAGKVYRVGLVFSHSPVSQMAGPEPAHPHARAFVRQLRDLGYVEGQNIIIERRSGEGKVERYGDAVADLVRLQMDVIVVATTPVAIAAKRTTTTIPIVCICNPIDSGLAASLARPGGNLTGVNNVPAATLASKRLELFKEAVPKLSRVAVIYAETEVLQLNEMARVARGLHISLIPVKAERPDDFRQALTAVTREHADGFIAVDSGLNISQRHRLVDFVAQNQRPALYPQKEYVDVGGLMSYGANLPDVYRRLAVYVDKILKGAKPGDLPVEQPTKFELVMNLKTAKALGLTIPPSLLLRADQVIE
jgi:putative tryptophan/tyrosine transport system substrate-binding protein